MDNVSSNQTNMIRTTESFSINNASDTSGIPAFAPVVGVVTSKRTLIDQLDQIINGTTKGVTLDTILLRKTMTDIAVRCAAATFAYAASQSNNTLKAQVDFTETKLNAKKKDEVDDVCQTIREVTDANIANVSNYGVSAGDTSSLQTAINLYRTSMQNPRQAKITKDEATNEIKKLIRDVIDNSFKDQMDKIVNTLKNSNPRFVSRYFSAREIINLGSTTAKLRGNVFIDADENPAVNATVILFVTGETTPAYQTKTNTEGYFTLPNLAENDYDLKIILPTFQDYFESAIHIAKGKEIKRQVTLIPA